jgi:DNA repair exonuclease SbcCD ATPase subunit
MAARATVVAADAQAQAVPETKRRRRRTAVSKWARPVYPIKAIWEAASEEEKQKARALTTEVLGYWLGQQSKTELAKELGVPPIRVWEMSQRAVAGMVAAMLKPPSGRRGRMPKLDPEVKELRKRIAELERENEVQRRLIRLLRTMPGNEKRELPKEERDATKSSRPRKKALEPRAAQPGPGAPPGT